MDNRKPEEEPRTPTPGTAEGDTQTIEEDLKIQAQRQKKQANEKTRDRQKTINADRS